MLMHYEIEFRPRAMRDHKRLSSDISWRIERKIEPFADDLSGDVKRLVVYLPGWGTTIYKATNHPPVGHHFVNYEGLSTDRYLRLTGAATHKIRDGPPPSPQVPGFLRQTTAPSTPARPWIADQHLQLHEIC
jgi:hypothetical protein